MSKNDEFYNRIKEEFDIRLFLEMTNNDRCKCPECGNETGDSAQVYDDHVVCFKCGNSGYDVISLYQMQNNLSSYFEAALELGKEKNIYPEFINEETMKKQSDIFEILDVFCDKCQNALKNEKQLYEKIKNKRGFTDKTMNEFRIGYISNEVMRFMQENYEPGMLIEAGLITNSGYFLNQKTNRIVYPYLDIRKKAKYFIYRHLEDEPSERKYVKHQVTEFVTNQVFGLSHLYDHKKDHPNLPLILTEGITDCISVLDSGYPSISAVTTKFAKKDYELLLKYCKRFKEVIVINDSEEPTEKMKERGITKGAGLDGAERTLKYLLENDINAFIAEIPRPSYIKKVDLDMYLKSDNPFEALGELVKTKQNAIGYFISKLNTTSTEDDIMEILGMIPTNRHAIRERALIDIQHRTGLQRRTLNNIVRDMNRNENTEGPGRAIDIFTEQFYDSEFYLNTPFYYLSDVGIWYMYNNDIKIYEIVNKDRIVKLIYEWFELMGISQTNSNITDCVKQTQSKKLMAEKIFNNHYMSLKNGAYNNHTNKFTPWDEIERPQNLLIGIHIPHPYDATQTKIPPLFDKMLEAFDYGKGDFPELGIKPIIELKDGQPTDKEMWIQYLVNMIHLQPIDRFLVLLIGPPDAGKSPEIKLIQSLMNPVTAIVNITELGKMGELQNNWFKLIYLDEDCNMGYAENVTMKFIKTNYSLNSIVNIRNLYSGIINEKGNKFICGASNQAFRLPVAYNSNAIFKRLLPLVCPNRYKRNVEMEEQMNSDEFLDQVFAYLLNQEVKPMQLGYNQIELQERNKILWNWSAFPLKRICEELFEFSNDYNDDVIDARTVYSMIGKNLEDNKMERPKKFFKQVEGALSEMGIEANRKKEKEFFGIKIRNVEKKEKSNETIEYRKLTTPLMTPKEEIYKRWRDTINLNPDVKWDPEQLKELELFEMKKNGDVPDDFDLFCDD